MSKGTSRRRNPAPLDVMARVSWRVLIAGSLCSLIGGIILCITYFVRLPIEIALIGLALMILGGCVIFAGLWIAERRKGYGRGRAALNSIRLSLRWFLFFIP